jgi:hypothetical protein
MCKHWYVVTKDNHKSIQPRQSVVQLAFELGTASSSRIEHYVSSRLFGHFQVVPFNSRRMWTCIPSSQSLYCAGNTVLFLFRFPAFGYWARCHGRKKRLLPSSCQSVSTHVFARSTTGRISVTFAIRDFSENL